MSTLYRKKSIVSTTFVILARKLYRKTWPRHTKCNV